MNLEDLPEYIRAHARIEREFVSTSGKPYIVVRLPFGADKTDRDWQEQPAAKKWLKMNGFNWDDGHFFWVKEVPD